MTADPTRWRARRHGGPVTHVGLDYGLTLTSSHDEVDPDLGMRPVSAAAQATLRELNAIGVALALVSKTLANQDRRPALTAAGVDAMFGARVYLSHELALDKATPAFFRHVLDDLGIAPGELLICGNNIDTDVRTPTALGISAVLLGPISCRTRLPPHTTVINQISDLPRILTGRRPVHA